MKVTLLYSKYLTDPTGASAVMRFLKQGQELFKDNGIDIKYFTRDDILPQKNITLSNNRELEDSLKDKAIRFIRNLSKTNPLAALIHIYVRSGRAAKLLVNTYRKKNQQNDIVFIHELETCYRYLQTRTKEDKSKVVLVIHDNGLIYDMTLIAYPSLKKRYFLNRLKKKAKYTLDNVDKLGFVSETSLLTFIKNNPTYPKDKLFFNLNGIPTCSVLPKKNTPEIFNICCVGTVNDRKGQRHIVDALKLLSLEERSKLHVNIIGDGEIKEELQQICVNNNLSEFISFWGRRDDITNILLQNDIFILPSENEGLPISILEAMRQGLPIVSTMVGGIPEMIIDGKTGIFIEPNTNSVMELFKNINKYNWVEMGRASKSLFETKFSLKSMIDKYSLIFSEVMNERKV